MLIPRRVRSPRSLQPPNRNASPRRLPRYDVEVLSMSENVLETIARLEKLAAWHRINAELAGADWVWQARLRTAEDLERQAAKLRAQLSSGNRSKSRSPLGGGSGEKHPMTSENVNRPMWVHRRRFSCESPVRWSTPIIPHEIALDPTGKPRSKSSAAR